METRHKIVIGDSRNMFHIPDKSVHLMITSPPYPMIEMWDIMFIKQDIRIKEEFNKFNLLKTEEEKERCISKIYDLMHENLEKVWKETYRVLVDGGIACINIGDATRSMNGLFRLFTNHSRITELCEKMGFVSLPFLLWKKATNKPNAFLGSGFYPPNAYITLDTEFILILRKGNRRILKTEEEKVQRNKSQFTKQERDIWFSQTWNIKGAKQIRNDFQRRTAEFPEEVVYRLTRMFSCEGEMILDPFLGTGTTTKVAKDTNRHSIGYEIDENLLPILKQKIGINQMTLNDTHKFEIIGSSHTKQEEKKRILGEILQ